jgi:hypothetical protein
MEALAFHTLRNLGVPLIHILYQPGATPGACTNRADHYEVRAPLAALSVLQNNGFSIAN